MAPISTGLAQSDEFGVHLEARVSLRKLNPPANFTRGVRAHKGRLPLLADKRMKSMARRKLSPSDILERLREIDSLIAHGTGISDALRVVGVLPAEYEKWRDEYAGLLRTLGPLACAPRAMRKSRRRISGRPSRTVKP
jgi:hypothetical protein